MTSKEHINFTYVQSLCFSESALMKLASDDMYGWHVIYRIQWIFANDIDLDKFLLNLDLATNASTFSLMYKLLVLKLNLCTLLCFVVARVVMVVSKGTQCCVYVC